jgi:hypothetical protein
MPVEDARPIVILSSEQERALLKACDDWQFPIFLTNCDLSGCMDAD